MSVAAARSTVGAESHGAGRSTTVALARLVLRLERVKVVVWMLALTALVAGTAMSYASTYATPADLASIGATMQLPITVALTGPYVVVGGVLSYGALVSQALLGIAATLVALFSVLTVVAHTRGDEEAGRTELLRSTAVHRHADLSSALLVVALADLAIGAAVAAGLAGTRVDTIDWAGSLVFGAALAATGFCFAGVAAVAAQVSQYRRGAAGLAGAVLGAAYAVRAVGDTGGSWLSWLSPLGWAQATQPFVGNRWWPLALPIGAGCLLALVALLIQGRRDLGAGLLAARDGRATARAGLATTAGLGLRLHRAGLLAWGAGLFGFGLAYGAITGDAEDLLAQVSALQDLVIPGSSITDSLSATLLLLLGILAGGAVVMAVLQLWADEATGRAEPLLSTATSRGRWAAIHVGAALVGGAFVLLLGGLGFGLGAAVTLHDSGELPRLVGAALVQLPPLLVIGGFAFVVVAVLPRWSALAWLGVAYPFAAYYAVTYLGAPSWLAWLSPASHVPLVPAEPVQVVPMVVLVLVAAVLVGIGLVALRRRDVVAG